MKKSKSVTIVRPAGNNTALIAGIPKDKQERKRINDLVMQQFPSVEQVGFYQLMKLPRLEMAGGEFCGNALRSFAYICLNGKKGSVRIRMSGTKKVLQAGIYKTNTAFAEIPVKNSIRSIKELSRNLVAVELEGITQLLTPLSANTSPDNLKKKAKKILEKNGLLYSSPAAGVMFIRKIKNTTMLNPVVWVRDIQTLFYETACASGTTALALYTSLQSSKKVQIFSIQQPTGEFLNVTVKKNKDSFKKAFIDGPIETLWKGEINL